MEPTMSTSDPDPLDEVLTGATSPAGEREELLARVYGELRSIAECRMRSEDGGHTLQATALVNEAYVRLVGDRALEWVDRREFFVAASEAMRRVLLDHARKKRSAKRGGGRRADMTLSGVDLAQDCDPDAVALLDGAMSSLEEEEPRAFQVVKLRYFGGLDVAEVAQILGVSERTVQREWTFARARLYQLLAADEPG